MRFTYIINTVLLALGVTAVVVPPTNPPSNSLARFANLEATLSTLDPVTTTEEDLNAIFSTMRTGLLCQTSAASPPIVFVHEAANNLIARTQSTQVCRQMNDYGSMCSRHESFKQADIGSCGNIGNGVKCHTVAWAAKHISNNCKNGVGQAGGKYMFSDVAELEIIIY